jgi:hypothetical protein
MTEQIARRRVIGADADLDLMFKQVDALRELASRPEQAQDSARVYDFSIRWGTLLHGRLERLAYYYGRGELAPEEQARYESLRGELQRAMPMIERLGLARPSMALDDSGPR